MGRWIKNNWRNSKTYPKKDDTIKVQLHMYNFFSIPLHHVIPDILHLFLMISDVLINLLILGLRRMDGIEKIRESEFKQTKAKNLDQYITFLNVNCRIPFYMYVDKESKYLKWRYFTSPEKVRFLKPSKYLSYFLLYQMGKGSTTMGELTRHLQNFVVTQKFGQNWRFYNKKATRWISLITDIYQTRNVHVLVVHIPEKFKSLTIYSQQGLEKLNDDITKALWAYYLCVGHVLLLWPTSLHLEQVCICLILWYCSSVNVPMQLNFNISWPNAALLWWFVLHIIIIMYFIWYKFTKNF